MNTSRHQLLPKIKILAGLIVSLVLAMVLASGCGSSPELQQEIRRFFYDISQHQPETDFVVWANQNLGGYSARAIYNALYEEGKYHAGLGHPNAVSLISFAAKDWAKAKDLIYEPSDWEAIQEEAVKNMRTTPSGELNIFENN
jgi:hypothetical protein